MITAVRQQAGARAIPSESGTNLLIDAARNGDSAAIRSLIAEGVNVNGATNQGTTPLMVAAACGQLPALQLLREFGAGVNQIRNDGFSALSLAVFFGHVEVVRELLLSGADMGLKGRSETTAEIWATARGFPKIAELLRERRDDFTAMLPRRESEPLKAPQSNSDVPRGTAAQPENSGEPFDEGIRRVGQAEWTATGSAGDHDPEILDDVAFTDGIRKVVKKEGQSSSPPELSSDSRPAPVVGSAKEESRTIGQTHPALLPESELTDYCPPAAGKSYSPFKALSDRLGVSWKYLAVLIAVGVTLGIGTVTWMQLWSKPKASSPASRQDSQIVSQPVSPQETLASESATVSSEQTMGEEVTVSNPAYGIMPEAQKAQSAVNEAEGLKSPNRYNRTPRSKKGAATSIARADNNEPKTPSTPPTVPKTTEPVKSAPAPNTIPPQPTVLIEGSSTKKKVIQWP